MAEDTKSDRFGGADEFRALSEARAALETVEQEHGRVQMERRQLRDRLDELLSCLREGAVSLLFDADGELAGAEGPVDEHLAVSLSDLVKSFEDYAGEETRRALDEANQMVMALDSSGVAISRSFLHSGDDRVGFTWIHMRRHDDDDELVGTEVIGLLPPTWGAEEDTADDEDPFESLLQQAGRRMLDDSGEATIARSIEAFGDLFSADRVIINRYDEDQRSFSVMSSWLRADTEPLAAETRGISISELPWAYSLLGAGESVVVSEQADLPAEAKAEKRLYASDGVKASLLVPMVRNDHLFGFVSLQSARRDRDWSAADVARARNFVRILSATLARAEVESELAETRREAASAAERSEDAEARTEQAESRAKENGEKGELLTKEVEEARRRIDELEKEAEDARAAAGEARAAADEERGAVGDLRKEAEDLRKEADELRKGAEDLRHEAEERRKEADEAKQQLEELEADAVRARQRADDSAADAEAVRRDLQEARKRAEDAAREAQEARAELRALQEVDRTLATAQQGAPKLAALDDAEDEAAAGIDAGSMEREFDPDATLEMDFQSFGRRSRPDAGELSAKLARVEDSTSSVEVSPRQDVDLSRAVGVEDVLEHTQLGRTLRQADEESGRPSWGGGKAEMALPRLLRNKDRDDEEDDLERDDTSEPDVEAADDRAADADEDLAAARNMARRVAGKGDDRADDDWWGVTALGECDGSDDDEEGDHSRDLSAKIADRRDNDESGEQERDGEDRDDDEDIVIETAWDEGNAGASELAEWDTAPPKAAALVDDEPAEEPAEEPEEEPEESLEDEEDAEEAAVELPDLVGVDAQIGLQDVGGNVELYRSLLIKFRNDYIGAAAKIDAAIEKGNIEVAHLLLHAIKGVSGILGAMQVRETADELETNLIGKDPAATRIAVGEFTVALNRVLDGIATLDEAPPADAKKADHAATMSWDEDDADDNAASDDDDAPGVSDPMILRSYLSGLRQHLLAEKPRQCQMVMREVNARKWPGSFEERLTELDEMIGDGSFAEARAAFEELMGMFGED